MHDQTTSDPGSGIRDPGSERQGLGIGDQGSKEPGVGIRDPGSEGGSGIGDRGSKDEGSGFPAHTTNVVVWDIPSAIVVGERFTIKVGMKCASECQLTNRYFRIDDDEGTQLATGTVGVDPWPGTTGLYVAEVELDAPAEKGLYTWSVKALGSDAEIPYAEGSVSFGVRVVSHPDFLVTVETVDKENQTPLSGARVVMHPYKAVTDEHGIAEVRVAKGAYKLFVSQSRYLTFGLPVEVDADMTTRAELYVEPVTERN
jgi:hypothetical protein